jgi:CheY-like chemotaxis protein
MSPTLPPNANKLDSAGPSKTANVTVFHLGRQDQDLSRLADILSHADWKLCPGTKWTVTAEDNLGCAADHLQGQNAPIVLCEGESESGNWREVLELLGHMPKPPMLIVASRMADEHLWAEALNLGAYDVLSKPYQPTEVIRVLSMAWLHWMNRRPAGVLARAS